MSMPFSHFSEIVLLIITCQQPDIFLLSFVDIITSCVGWKTNVTIILQIFFFFDENVPGSPHCNLEMPLCKVTSRSFYDFFLTAASESKIWVCLNRYTIVF